MFFRVAEIAGESLDAVLVDLDELTGVVDRGPIHREGVQ